MNDVEQYVAEVRAALADLSPSVRDELLEDLPAHLAEVAAEGDEPLRSRLGPPAEYAAELRATVGVGRSSARPPVAARLAAAAGAVRGRLRTVDVRLGPVIGYARASDFLVLLRPAWWVLRGYLAAMAVVYLLDDSSGSRGLLPRLGGSFVTAVVLLTGFIVGSIWFGRRRGRLARWPRRAVDAASVLLVLVAFVAFIDMDSRTRNGDYYRTVDNPYPDVWDVYGYDANGQLLRDVRLFDQNGNPILFNGLCGNYVEPLNAYPRCPDQAPFTVPGLSPTPSGTAIPTATATPTPTETASPTLTASPTPRVTAPPTR